MKLILKSKRIEAYWYTTLDVDTETKTARVMAHWQMWWDDPAIPNDDGDIHLIEDQERIVTAAAITAYTEDGQKGSKEIYTVTNPAYIFSYPRQ